MPKDALYEESAQPVNGGKQAKWYTAFLVLSIILTAIAFFHLAICIMILPSMTEGLSGGTLVLFVLMWIAPCIACLLTAFLFFRLRLRFNVSYDYLFVQDELRVTKVFNGRKRKHIVTLEADHILQIGYCEGDSFERTQAGQNGAKPKFLSPNREASDDKEYIYILYSSTLGKTMYILECRKMLLEYVVAAAGRNKFIRE